MFRESQLRTLLGWRPTGLVAVPCSDAIPQILIDGRPVVVVGELVGFAHRGRHVLVVLHQFAQHLARRDVILVIVVDGLQLGDLPDRADRGAAELAHPFGELIGGGENSIRLLVQHQVVVVEMPAADMPVEILRLQVEGESIRQQRIERLGYLVHGGLRQVGRGIKLGGCLVGFVAGFAHVAPSC